MTNFLLLFVTKTPSKPVTPAKSDDPNIEGQTAQNWSYVKHCYIT